MQLSFKDWCQDQLLEGMVGYIAAQACEVINEGRRDPTRLQNQKEKNPERNLFNEPLDVPREFKRQSLVDPTGCPITPLSGYKKHIEAIKGFAQQGPDQFAQVLIFSPLSANVSFAKHWDNFQVLMLILKHYFPQKVDRHELEMVIDAFNDYLYSMPMTVNGFKLDTVTYVWNNRESMMHELNALAKEGDDNKLIARLSQIPGVQPVKGGFIAQLLYGRAGCIDTHNIDIYTKVFPDMANRFNPKDWGSETDAEGNPIPVPKGQKQMQLVKNYTRLLGDLDKKHGIGTEQLWDVWVDFVESMYILVTKHGKGYYADMGSSLNPDDPVYKALQNVKIPKTGIGANKKNVHVPLVTGVNGMGASATHLQMDPDDALHQFDKIYRRGEKGSDAAHAIPFHLNKFGAPLDPTSGLGREPTSLHYFDKALSGKDVDPEMVRHIIRQRLEKGGKKAIKARNNAAQGRLDFGA